MKKHSALKFVLLTMLVFMVFTWIFPAAYFQTSYVDQGRVQMGLFDLFNYPLTALSYFGYISLYVLVVGGFYGILYKIPAYRNFLDLIAKKFKGKEFLFVACVSVLLAGLVSFFGIQIELVLFFPMIISLIMLMGYDKIVAAFTIVGSTMIGIAGTTYGYANVNLIVSDLGVHIDSNLLIKIAILLIGVALLLFNVYQYIKKSSLVFAGTDKKATKVVIEDEDEEDEVEEKVVVVKKTTTTKKTTSNNRGRKSSSTTRKSSTKKGSSNRGRKSNSSRNNHAFARLSSVISVDTKEEVENEFVPNVADERHSIWAIVSVIVCLFVLVILAFIPWSNAFGVTVFDNATTSATGYEIFGFALFGKLLGTTNAFGLWGLADMFLPLAIVVLFLALVYKLSLSEVLEGFEKGAKRALLPAGIVLLIYTILVLVTYHPFQLVIYKAILGLTKNFNVFTTTVVTFLASIFNADPTYVQNAYLPYFASLFDGIKVSRVCAIISQSIYGITMLVAPTSLVLMSVLSYLDIPYTKWLKTIWKLFVELLVILLIIFLILASVG